MICGFTLQHYKECLQLAKDKDYDIRRVKDYDNNKEDKKVILLRHDVDFSLEYAYELANFEYDLGVKSSYYVYLHSELYNALSPKSMAMIREMENMGHEIGLHTEGTNCLQNEYDIIPDIIEDDIHSWTFHLPGLRDNLVYFHHLVNPQRDIPFKFISDSGRNWREGCMCTKIGKINKLHILTHPEWWVSGGTTREDAVHKLWQSNIQNLVRNMTDIKQMLVDYVRDDLRIKQ